MVVILDLGDGLDDAEQLRYDQFIDSVRSAAHAAVWTNVDPVPADCKPLPRGVLGYAFHVDLQGRSPMPFVPSPTTAEEVQEFFALDVEKVADQIIRVCARDVIKASTFVAQEIYDPTPTFERARRHLDDLLTTHGYATT